MDGFLAITINDAVSCLALSTCIIKQFHTKSRTTTWFYPSSERCMPWSAAGVIRSGVFATQVAGGTLFRGHAGLHRVWIV